MCLGFGFGSIEAKGGRGYICFEGVHRFEREQGLGCVSVHECEIGSSAYLFTSSRYIGFQTVGSTLNL